MVKTTGLPDAPPVADSVICWPICNDVGGLKPVMVCGRIDDTVAVPLMFTLNVNSRSRDIDHCRAGLRSVGSRGRRGEGGRELAGRSGRSGRSAAHPLLAAGTRVNMVFVGSVTTGVAKVAAVLPALMR